MRASLCSGAPATHRSPGGGREPSRRPFRPAGSARPSRWKCTLGSVRRGDRPRRAEDSRASACEVCGLGRPGASHRLPEKPEFGAQLWASRSLLGLAFVHLGKRCPDRQPTPAGRVGPAAQGRVTRLEKSAAPSGVRDWVRVPRFESSAGRNRALFRAAGGSRRSC